MDGHFGLSEIGTGQRNTLTMSIYLTANVEKTVTVVLKAKDTIVSQDTKYENQGSINGVSSHDYVKCKYSITSKTSIDYASADIRNYIVSVNSNGTVTDYSKAGRNSFDNNEAIEKPVTVKKGDIVTYRLEVEDTSSVNIISFNIRDIMEDGLEIVDSLLPAGTTKINNQELIFSFSNLGKTGSGTTTKYIDIPLKVTKSDMYLFTVGDEFTMVDGYYWQRHTTYYVYSWDSEYGKDLESEKTIINYTQESLTESTEVVVNSDKNKDYIQLDDVTIGGLIWYDGLADGVYGSSPGGISDLTVYLYRINPSTNKVELVAKTTPNSSGNYTFEGVSKGYVAHHSEFSGATRKYDVNSLNYTNSGYYQYYVEFEYSGIKYEITPKYFDTSNIVDNNDNWCKKWYIQNHASESYANTNERNILSDSLETIAYNIAYAGKTGINENSTNLSYTFSNHSSTIDDSSVFVRARSVMMFVMDDTDVNNLGSPCVENTEYLKHINLGLLYNYEVDISTQKDLMKAYVEINGNTTTYVYDKLGTGEYVIGDYNKISTPYTLKIYEGDYNYRTNGVYSGLGKTEDDELKITLTFKISVTASINKYGSTTEINPNKFEVQVPIREIVDYTTDEMTLLSVKDSSGTLDLKYSTSSNYNDSSLYSYSGYNTIFITGTDSSNPVIFTLSNKDSKGNTVNSSTDYIILTYRVNKYGSDNKIKLDDESSEFGKVSIAEVSAYSIYDNKDSSTQKASATGILKPAGLVDCDSNAGSLNTEFMNKYGANSALTNTDLYDDDTFQTSIKIILRDQEHARTVNGCVWEEDPNVVTNLGEMIGDGKRSSNEIGAAGVEVYLMEVIEYNSEQYLVYTGAHAVTDGSGDYCIMDTGTIHAGKYIARFIYGNSASNLKITDGGNLIKYSGQDYMSTVYTPIGNTECDEIDPVTKKIRDLEADEFLNNTSGIVSRAADNELRRLEVINFSSTMTYTLDSILKAEKTIQFNELSSRDSDYTLAEIESYRELALLTGGTSMYADTKAFNIRIEYIGYYETNSSYAKYVNKNAITPQDYVKDGTWDSDYIITQVNFGLIQRPEEKLQLMNDITEIVATTVTNEEIIHLYFDVKYSLNSDGTINHEAVLNANKSKGSDNVPVLNRIRNSSNSYSTQGFRYVNIDTDILQGLTIKVKFKVSIANISDIDTANQNLINLVEDNKLSSMIEYLLDYTTSGRETTTYNYVTAPGNVTTIYKYSDLSKAIADLENNSELSKYKAQGVDSNGYYLRILCRNCIL
jgi:hypothetical protein